MSASIEELQRKIAELQLGIAPQTIVPAITNEDSIKTLVRQAIREELSLLKDSTLVKPEVPVVPTRELSMLEAIGQCLSQEEQLWLSRPDILQQVDKNLSKYFQTEDGKSAIKQFITYFRGFYEN